MIFVDSNVFIYAVGRSHPLKAEAQDFFLDSSKKGKRLVTSAEVLQELLHAYLPVERMKTLDAAMELATHGVDQVIPIDSAAVLHARNLVDNFPALTARDLLHLSVCQLNKIKNLKTFDRNLLAVFKKG
jgi:predicted nucleic acid-binding protein